MGVGAVPVVEGGVGAGAVLPVSPLVVEEAAGSGVKARKQSSKGILLFLGSVFRIRIRLDPYHWTGSGSVSGNFDLDVGTKKKS